jgi:3-oxoacyl-[acyl-carrier-protein] synthase-3
MALRSVVKGYGAYLPAKILTNAELEKTIETNDSWIVERTGIRQRHIAAEGEYTSHLAMKAAQAALARANLAANDIDLLILATTTPDESMPSTATKVQHLLGMTQGAAFDLAAACSGFVYGLATADAYIRSGQAKRVLVIGAETFSRLVDWNDRATCILFGDGAGAVVLEAEEGKGNAADRGILFTKLYSDGQYNSILRTTGGISSGRDVGYVTMAGKEVFRHAVAKMSDVVTEGLNALSLQAANADWVIPHQANSRILDSVAKRLELGKEKMISTVAEHANTSAASIPLALSVAADQGKIKRGQLLVMPALGAGLTWGACILRW